MNRRAKKVRLATPSEERFREEECLNIYWHLKNFSYCYECYFSPKFKLCGEYNMYLSLKLDHKEAECHLRCENNLKFSADTEISFLTCDGSEEAVSQSLCLKVSRDIIFGQRRSAFLPENTITVRCRIKGTSYEKGKVSFYSRIGVRRSCFIWTLKDIGKKECVKHLQVEGSDEYGKIGFNLESVGGIHSDEQFFIKISKCHGKKCHCILKVSVLNDHGKLLNYASDEFTCESETDESWRFPPIIRKSKLFTCTEDKLSLKCDFAFTLGKVEDHSVFHSYAKDVVPLLTYTDDLPMSSTGEKPLGDIKVDLKNILDDGTLSDVIIQVGCRKIPAHKAMLSARSPVFKAMFTNDMKETIEKIVVIKDLNLDTVRRFLLFMYTDTIYDYQWEKIMNFYFVADKYEVLRLKQKCSAYLVENLSSSNVCEVLALADLHKDADLKSAVHHFISKYRDEVYKSDAWKEFKKNNSRLASQTMQEI